MRLCGFVANPMHSRANNRMQYLFLNGRFIRDRSLQHALGEAYRGLLLTGRYPICFLHLEMPPEAVDVNVHPTKLEVRFQDGGRIYSQLLGTLRTKFLVDRPDGPRRSAGRRGRRDVGGDDELAAAAPATSDLWEWAKRQLGPAASDGDDGRDFAPASARRRASRRAAAPSRRCACRAARPLRRVRRRRAERAARDAATRSPAAACRGAPRRIADSQSLSGRPRRDDGLVVIDQHALHERILYEQLREQGARRRSWRRSGCWCPSRSTWRPAKRPRRWSNRELLAQLGVEVEPFGGDTVLVSSYPAMLANFAPAEVLRGVVEQLLAGGKRPEPRDLLDELLHMIACKAAVKAGDRLTPEEIDALLEQRGTGPGHHHCPHGRPTALVFTREELDRQFKRI